MKEAKAESAVARREKKGSVPVAGTLAGVRSWPKQVRSFLGDVRSETRRVTWPTAKQIKATTVVVIVTVFFFGAYFGILDWVYSALVGWLLRFGS